MIFSDSTKRIFFLSFFFSFIVTALNAQNGGYSRRRIETIPRFELNEIVVTASRIEEPIWKVPKNVTVITSEDIEQAPSNNVIDLFARESGINLKSQFGHDKWSGLDIRGMGDTSTSNVIVMMDGIRLNPPDLAGPDLSSIPLDQIERIEILRGAGSVMYGNGAVGGVINIITKKGSWKKETRLFCSNGSFDTKDIRLSSSGAIKEVMLNARASYYESEGYRDNGGLNKKDLSLNSEYPLNDRIRFSLNASIHEDMYGLPSWINKEDKDSRELRIKTHSPEDNGETIDRRYIGGIEIDLGSYGTLTAQRGYRFRKNSYIMGFNPLKSKESQTDQIDDDSRNLNLDYVKSYELLGLNHRFQGGLEYYETEYISEKRSNDIRKNIEAKSLGIFMANDFTMRKDLVLRLGYRHNAYKDNNREDENKIYGEVERWENGEVLSNHWSNNAYEAGITYSFNQDTSLFASFATSFRLPNVDELALADEDLHPQKGTHLEIGGRRQIKGLMELSLTLFHMEIEDEILYIMDPNKETPLNLNYYQRTLHTGFETDLKLYPMDTLYLWGNYSFIEARLKQGGPFMPLVPKHKASIGLEWTLSDHFLFNFTGTFVGSRFDGNDLENNQHEKLGGYEVLDIKLTYRKKKLKLFVGINNILDEYYSTIAYSETYYPMPMRNFYGGVEWQF